MFDTLTTPVPPGVSLKSAFDDVPIMLSLNVKLSIVVVPAKVDVPLFCKFVKVVKPVIEIFVKSKARALENVDAPKTFKVPSNIKFSFILIDEESVALIVVPLLNPIPAITT